MASDSIEGAFMLGPVGWKGPRGSKWNRAGGKKPPEARIRPLWGQRQLEIKGSNIGADNWSVDAEEEGLENRHNFQVTTT
ncbi:MAG: hypothetical protein QGI86_22795 [Candidatus Poribacteria bacterium]|nr:hypothetical protein [Candidatus Poribacteria bacterium]